MPPRRRRTRFAGTWTISRPSRRPKATRDVPARPRQVRAEAAPRGRARRPYRGPAAGDCRTRARSHRRGVSPDRRQAQWRRSRKRVGAGQAAASRARRAGQDRAGAAGRARSVSRETEVGDVAGRRAGDRRAHTGLLPLVHRQHVDAGAVRDAAVARLLLRDRRRSVVDPGASEGTPARLQSRHAVVHLDARGVSGSLPAVPAPALGRVEGAQVALLRAGDLCRGLGALRRRDDDRSRLRQEGPLHPPRAAAGVAHPPGPLHRLDPPPHRGSVGRAGRAAVPRTRDARGSHGAARGRARHV